MKRSSLPPAGSVGPCRALRCEAVLRARRLGIATATAVAVSLVPAVYAATRVSVTVGGNIAPSCTIGGLGSSGTTVLTLADITQAGTKDFGFTLDCNAPFSYSLTAEHGELRNTSAGTASGGFSAKVPYTVAVTIPTNVGTIDDTCSGESIRVGGIGCSFSNSGSGIALSAAGNLRMAWIPAGMLAAGEYEDSVTIAVGLR